VLSWSPAWCSLNRHLVDFLCQALLVSLFLVQALVVPSVIVSSSPFLSILQIKDPNNNILGNKEFLTKGKFSFVTDGGYEICFYSRAPNSKYYDILSNIDQVVFTNVMEFSSDVDQYSNSLPVVYIFLR